MVLPELRGAQGLASEGPGAPPVRFLGHLVVLWILCLLGLALAAAGLVLLLIALVQHFGQVLALTFHRG